MSETHQSPQLDVDRFARATQKVVQACSDYEGMNCFCYAHTLVAALQRLEFAAVVRVGYAAWRVGPSPGDVVLHHPAGTQVDTLAPGQRGLLYHAWVQVGKQLLDCTLYQLPEKARALTVVDGIATTVSWCPDYLWAPVQSARKIGKVINGTTPGVYCYEPNRIVHDKLKHRENYRVDEYHVDAILMLYAALAKGDIAVFGPSNLGIDRSDHHG